jgi:cystathionine beta-lyase
MKYNFDKIIKRSGSGSVKWDSLEPVFGHKDLLPMWVADMDFEAPEPIVNTMLKKARHGIYGYTEKPKTFYDSITEWVSKRHGWKINNKWIVTTPGVVPALSISILSFTEPGDKVLIQSPVYHPFHSTVENNGRVVVDNQLKLDKGRYEIDFEDMERKLSENVKMMILCNPHNPVGNVWSYDDLLKIGDLCVKYDVIIVSDEIHSDLVYKGKRHIPIASILKDFSDRTITCMAPSKTFNVAGLSTSVAIIANKDLLRKFKATIARLGIGMNNLFGIFALRSAYLHCEDWLEELLVYLEGNADFLVKYIETNIPKIKVRKPEATYLAWLDFRELGLDQDSLVKLLVKKAKVGLNDGMEFGPGGEGFMRLNFACPRSVLEEGLKRIENAVNEL